MLLSSVLEAVGFGIRHGAWALSDAESAEAAFTPTLITPGDPPNIASMPGNTAETVPLLRVRRDAVAPGLPWTVLIIDAFIRVRGNKTDAFLAEYTVGGGEPAVAVAPYRRDETGQIVVDDMFTVGSDQQLAAFTPEHRAEIDAGIQTHRDVIEPMIAAYRPPTQR